LGWLVSFDFRDYESIKRKNIMRIYCNNDWKFAPEFLEEMCESNYREENMETVRIPHNVAETPFSYFDEHIYQKISGYRRSLWIEKEWQGKVLLLTF